MKIVVLDGHTLNPGDNPWDGVIALGETVVHQRTDVDDVVHRAGDADIILTNKTPLGEAALQSLPRLKFISILATGYDVVDLETAGKLGIPVSNVPEYGTDAVAQYVFAMLLELCHRVADHDRAVQKGEWTGQDDFSFWKSPQVELAGKTMGIVGYGRIGRRVGELAHALGMDVVAHNPLPKPAPDYVSFVHLGELFTVSDVITLHCPMTDDNREFVSHHLISRMRPWAFFINTARGSLVNEQDLADALRRESIAGAALDVVSHEPIQPDNPLLHLNNCLITPHMAWAALEARKRLMRQTVKNISAFLSGHPVNVVNREYLVPREGQRTGAS